MDALRSREYDGGSEFIEQVCQEKLLCVSQRVAEKNQRIGNAREKMKGLFSKNSHVVVHTDHLLLLHNPVHGRCAFKDATEICLCVCLCLFFEMLS